MDYQATLRALVTGKVCVFPTETFYGIGCLARERSAVQELLRIKNRPPGKALPLIIGCLEQLALVSPAAFANGRPESGRLASDFLDRLVRCFWPGPLTLLLPAADWLAPEITGGTGLVAVRWTSHPVAERLCMETRCALVASSANRSGQPPAARKEDLDALMLEATAGCCEDGPRPAGRQASTLVSLAGPPSTPERLVLRRAGAIPPALLVAAGFSFKTV
jgi:L-threonylcarbamoyladenylate synthase